jgi:hypothetical protein
LNAMPVDESGRHLFCRDTSFVSWRTARRKCDLQMRSAIEMQPQIPQLRLDDK